MNREPNEPLELPEVFEAMGDEAQLLARLQELARDTEIESVRLRGATGCLSLAELATAVQAGELRAAQIRYRSDGQLWIETVMRSGAAFKIVRMAGLESKS